jgi:hypothetical protein
MVRPSDGLRANTIIASCWPRPRQKNCSPPDSFPDSEAPMSTRAQGWPLRLWTSSRHSFLRQWTRCLGSAASSRGLRRCCWRARQTTRSCCWSVPTGPPRDWNLARTRRSSCAIRSARRDSLQPCRAASRSRCWRARFVAPLHLHPDGSPPALASNQHGGQPRFLLTLPFLTPVLTSHPPLDPSGPRIRRRGGLGLLRRLAGTELHATAGATPAVPCD